MTTKTAELSMAIFLLLASIALMFKSAELNIGWIPGRGPGAGMWPFYLALGMALTCLATIFRWYRRTTPQSRNEDPFLSPETFPIVAITTATAAMTMETSTAHERPSLAIGSWRSARFDVLMLQV